MLKIFSEIFSTSNLTFQVELAYDSSSYCEKSETWIAGLAGYLSEKEAMERLKVSLVKKSRVIPKIANSNRAMLASKKSRIYKLALMPRGGIDDIIKHEFSNEIFKLAGDVKNLIERLVAFCAERELKGVAKIFFKSGRLMIELILAKCNIGLAYEFIIAEGRSVQVIVMTSIVGGGAGFTWSWFSAGGMLIAPPVLLGTLISRSMVQQFVNYRESKKFKELVLEILEDKKDFE